MAQTCRCWLTLEVAGDDERAARSTQQAGTRQKQPGGLNSAKEVPFNSAATLGDWIAKQLRPTGAAHGAQGPAGIRVVVVGEFGKPPDLPPIPFDLLAPDRWGLVARCDAPIAEQLAWLARGERDRPVFEECLSRGRKVGLAQVPVPPEQARNLRALAAEEQARVLAAEEARTGLKLNGLLLSRARTALGKWAIELMRSLELLTSFAEAGGELPFWIYGKQEANKVENGGRMCGECGTVDADAGGLGTCGGCGGILTARTGSFTGVRSAVGVKGNPPVKWNDAREGRSVMVVREKLLAMGLCRWEASAEKHRKDKRVRNKWFDIADGAPGAAPAEPQAAPTTRQLAALIWQLYAEVAAAP